MDYGMNTRNADKEAAVTSTCFCLGRMNNFVRLKVKVEACENRLCNFVYPKRSEFNYMLELVPSKIFCLKQGDSLNSPALVNRREVVFH